MNSKISEEAHNLTRALKGDVKKQGNWGEIMLERILERSGLRKGSEYDMQVSSNNEEGKRVIPDAIIYLPGNKHIIIDSKVSLIAYEHYVNETDDEKRKSYAAEHILSLKAHIKGLSEKHYQQLAELHTPDFVLMFIPLESSFGLAIQSDHEIFNYAWDNKIVMVSPSTLFATMLTIASIWKQENQARNAKEIAEQTARLYDKFTAFVSDLEKIGNSINGLQNIYNDAFSKLSTGKGNLINRIEKIKKLGLSTSKSLNVKYIEEQNENETEDDEKLS